jgi:hypothetical protein
VEELVRVSKRNVWGETWLTSAKRVTGPKQGMNEVPGCKPE